MALVLRCLTLGIGGATIVCAGLLSLAAPPGGDPFAPSPADPFAPGPPPPAQQVCPQPPPPPPVPTIKIALTDQPGNTLPAKAGMDGNSRIEAALDCKIDVELTDAPLDQVATALSKTLDISVRVDIKPLANVGIDKSTPLRDQKLTAASARSLLQSMLEVMDLTFVVGDDECLITTREVADDSVEVEVYDVRDFNVAESDVYEEGLWLFETLQTHLAPETWEDAGSSGRLSCREGVLVISQTRKVQRQVPEFLAQLRHVKKLIADWDGKAKLPAVAFPPRSPEQKAIDLALEKRLTLDVADRPLKQLADELGKQYSILIFVDRSALDAANIDVQSKVTYRCREQPLRIALRNIAKQLNLAVCIDRNVVLFTTPEVVAEILPRQTRIYPVPDLAPDGPFVREALQEIEETITAVVDPLAWSDQGGIGNLHVLPSCRALIVSAPDETHDRIEQYQTKLRNSRAAASELRVTTKKHMLPAYLGGSPGLKADDFVDYIVERTAGVIRWNVEGSLYKIKAYGNFVVVTHNALGHRRVDNLMEEFTPPYQGLGGVLPVGDLRFPRFDRTERR